MLLTRDGRYIPAQCCAKPEPASSANSTKQSKNNSHG